MNRETLRLLIEHEAIHRVAPGQRPLKGKAPGSTYAWQFYLRRVLYRGAALDYVGRAFRQLFEDAIYAKQPFQIAGVESAAVPVLSAIAMAWPELNVFSIRKARKSYGLENWLEGTPNGLPVMLVDDLISPTHATFQHGMTVLVGHRLPVLNHAFAVVEKRGGHEPGFGEVVLGNGFKVLVHALFTLDDFTLGWTDYLRRYGLDGAPPKPPSCCGAWSAE